MYERKIGLAAFLWLAVVLFIGVVAVILLMLLPFIQALLQSGS